MKLIWKIIIAVFVVLIGLGVVLFLSFKNLASIDELAIDQSDSQTEKVEKANQWLQKLQEDNKFNGAVLLIKNDSILLKNAYGYTDFTKKETLTNQSSFRLASVSKQFTGVGIMLLKEQGKLNFDDEVTKFFPNFPYKNVTVRHLLNHTSGVPDIYMDFTEKYKEEIGEALTIRKVADLIIKENAPKDKEPNEAFNYNNTGYVLLAAIIEEVSGQSFENFMQEFLFSKLDMPNTRVWNLVSKDKTFKNKTSSFRNVFDNVTELRPGVIDGVAGDGAVFSSIDDFVVWNQFWNQNKLLSKEIIKEAFKTVTLKDGKESKYGFGWSVLNENAHSHSGSWLGARTMIIRNTELKNCLVILDNSSTMIIDNMIQELVKVLK